MQFLNMRFFLLLFNEHRCRHQVAKFGSQFNPNAVRGILLPIFASLGLSLAPAVLHATDSDSDGIPDAVEGALDSDDDGIANYYDLDSDNDGLSDAYEGSMDADGDGIPNFLDLDSDRDGYSDELEGGFDGYESVAVAPEFKAIVDAALSEGSNVDESFINPAYRNDLVLSEAAEVSVTFIDEGAGYRNAVGYYIFPQAAFAGLSKADVDTDASGVVSLAELKAISGVETGWLFPNASKLDNNGGILVEGDSYTLGNGRVFAAGTRIGFFLVVNAWRNGTILAPDDTGRKPEVIYTTDFINPVAESSANLSTDSSTNRSRQVALLFADQNRNEIIVGFEDISRRWLQRHNRVAGDQDFNDAVFSVKSSPSSALSHVGVATANTDGTDADGDGILDADELPGDTDGDGVPNVNDPDDDGDGIVTPTEGSGDADGDSTANYLDTDSDNDGIDDAVEGAEDADLDGVANYLDTDSDGDNVPDSLEAGLDSDADGIPDRIDVDDDGDNIATIEEGAADFDNDGTADYLDTDSDNDSIPDREEAAFDSDGDTILNRYDTDDDNDGILTVVEGQADTDSDGLGDYLDLDSDNDGFSDSFEGHIDSDGDGLANRIDDDDDNDGILSADEGFEDLDDDGLANYLDSDSDGDGVDDGALFTDVALSVRTAALQSNYTGKPLVSGDQITYIVTISNSGEDTATQLEVGGLVPAHTTFVDASLTVNGSSILTTLTPASTLQLGTLPSNQSKVLSLVVAVNESLPADLNKISSVVSVDCLQSYATVISDNDPTGHCGIVDDGLDHAADSGLDTSDDDPTQLPLLQGTFAETCTLAFEDLQNAGWCDWDMNDIVLDITSYYVVDQSNAIESMVVTYQLLARGAGMDSKLNLTIPYSGYAQWQRIYLDLNGAIEANTLGAATDSATVVLSTPK